MLHTTTPPNPGHALVLAAIAAGTLTACWWIRREGNRVADAVGVRNMVDPETAAAARRIHLRLLEGGAQRN